MSKTTVGFAARSRLQKTSALLLACHLVEIIITAWLATDLWKRGHRTSFVVMATVTLITNTVIGLLSLLWVHRQLWFGDRCVGRLLCYVLHALGGCLVWRACKLALVFDVGDVRELVTLRHLLVHIQTLPVCLIQLYVSYSGSGLDTVHTALVAVLLGSAVVTAVLASAICSHRYNLGHLVPSLVPSQVREESPLVLPRMAGSDWTGSDDRWSHLLVCVQTLCLLWARLISVAAFASLWLVWTLVATVLHLSLSAIWLTAQQFLLHGRKGTMKRISHIGFLSYLLVYDWQVIPDLGESRSSGCSKPRWTAGYYVLAALENASFLALWVTFSDHLPHTKLATVTGAAATFAVGAVILIMLYCYSTENTANSTDSTRLSRVTPSDEHVCKVVPPIPIYVDCKSDEEIENIRMQNNVYTAFPVLAHSDRSTDNRSSNSRNTNTLCEPDLSASEPPLMLQVAPPPRGVVTSTPNRSGPWERVDSNPECDASCHCRLFDVRQRPKLHVLEPVHATHSHLTAERRSFSVACASCLCAHDPLLTGCARTFSTAHRHTPINLQESTAGYPSDSEPSASCEASASTSSGSQCSHRSCSTYTTWPPRSAAGGAAALASFLPPELSARQYVRAWLEFCEEPLEALATQPRKKLCRVSHATCPPYRGQISSCKPPTPLRSRKRWRKNLLKTMLRPQKTRHPNKQRARSVSPQWRAKIPPRRFSTKMECTKANLTSVFIQNVEAYL